MMEQSGMDRARRALLSALDNLSYFSHNDILIVQSLQSTAMTGFFFEEQRLKILALAKSYDRLRRLSNGSLQWYRKELAYHRFIAYEAMDIQQRIGECAVCILDGKPERLSDYQRHYGQRTSTAVYAAFKLVAAETLLRYPSLEADAEELVADGRKWNRAFKETIRSNNSMFMQSWKTTVKSMLVPAYSESEAEAVSESDSESESEAEADSTSGEAKNSENQEWWLHISKFTADSEIAKQIFSPETLDLLVKGNVPAK